MPNRLSKLYLSEAVREILLSMSDSARDVFTPAECEHRIREGYGDFCQDDFDEAWSLEQKHMRPVDRGS